MSHNRRIDATGIAWYSRENYVRCLSLFDDGEQLPDTYDDWLKKANETVRQLTLAGQHVIKAEIDPNTFPAWCKAHGFKRIDAQARSYFGTRKAEEVVLAERASSN
jgi:hypothetical protein